MKKKIIILISCVFIVIIISILSILILNKKEDKFYLDDKFYNNGEFIKVTSDEFNKLDKKNYVLFTYNNFCHLQVPCDQIFLKVMKKYKIDFISMEYVEYKNTFLHDTVKYAPTIIIVKDGKIVSYLDSEKDSDLDKYQDVEVFDNWISQYIYTQK